ncbi:molybdate ABC transporter substrate-binding protein [Methyloceanibacter caenitepidi]|uniref:Molybdenum ABC transporter, periplasmic molybdenum-binding protein ModA n=1 Tax=Methyloceanibacter caenitepidi TaxID=1384459 RepID=A0A0A8K0Y0_9HYPH|nr:molybdate ABC transporter substrate-binding protein [Methyloceanibacter caenitepidi]BAQ16633.1 molybdenum ABC transporter, periplasmic molybdenum-binding protein ModA [Methyloceanibacter caenitepidi]
MKHTALRVCFGLVLAAFACVPATSSHADEATIAVAANFTSTARKLGAVFEASTGHHVVFSFGATGQLYTQIAHGAPFDAFLAADQERPELAVSEGHAVSGTRFTYAIGLLVLWSADPQLIDGTPAVLSDPTLRHVAIANPATAPYGAAAVETMKALSVFEDLKPRLVEGKNVSQTYQFVATGNAPVGFVAASQILENDTGSSWAVPANMYAPLRQDAVLLTYGRDNEAAKDFLEFLRGTEAAKLIERLGYRPPGEN